MDEVATGYGLIEGPVWDPARGLIFADVPNGGAYCLGKNGKVSEVFPHRKGMGGMALHQAGGLVVSGRAVSFKPFDGGDTISILEPDESLGEKGFNDLTIDPDGRIYVGSVGFRPVGSDDEPRPGALYMIDLDGAAHMQAPRIELTNGIGVTADGCRVFHSDSLTNAVWIYSRMADGTLHDRRMFAHLGDGHTPDGLVVAMDDTIWVADARGGEVVVYGPSGDRRKTIPVPLPMVTSVCFGGDDLKTLYIVTGSRDSGRENGGSIFAMDAGVSGVPVPECKVALG